MVRDIFIKQKSGACLTNGPGLDCWSGCKSSARLSVAASNAFSLRRLVADAYGICTTFIDLASKGYFFWGGPLRNSAVAWGKVISASLVSHVRKQVQAAVRRFGKETDFC